MRLLDLFSGAGGAAAGYAAAGFEVVGVDHAPQPRYPFEFVQADALEFVADHGHKFDAVHASPPCHDHSTLRSLSGLDGTGDLLPATRDLLDRIDRPYVIENVPGAPMRPDLILCGAMFGLRTYRHRWFELGGWWALCPMHPPHTVPTSPGRGRMEAWAAGLNVSITGDIGSYVGPEAMGIGWMTGAELSQAIPPAYTQHVGELLAAHLTQTPGRSATVRPHPLTTAAPGRATA